jgi:hypothetical protein
MAISQEKMMNMLVQASLGSDSPSVDRFIL